MTVKLYRAILNERRALVTAHTSHKAAYLVWGKWGDTLEPMPTVTHLPLPKLNAINVQYVADMPGKIKAGLFVTGVIPYCFWEMYVLDCGNLMGCFAKRIAADYGSSETVAHMALIGLRQLMGGSMDAEFEKHYWEVWKREQPIHLQPEP